MSGYLQVTAGVLIAIVLGLSLQKQGKDISILLSMAVCCMVITVGVGYLEPVLSFADKLRSLAKLDNQTVGILLKAVGIGLISEIAEVVCNDSGNGAMGKAVQMLSGAVILWLSLPLLESLLSLIERILEGL